MIPIVYGVFSVPKKSINEQITSNLSKQLPEWANYQTAIGKINSSLNKWDRNTLEAEYTNITQIKSFNVKTYNETLSYLNEFGISKEISNIFLQNDQLLERIVKDIEKQPVGKSKVLLHLHIQMAEELMVLSKQLDGAMQNHIQSMKTNYLKEEKTTKSDTKKIIESRKNLEIDKNTDYDPFSKH